jgi:hypothetical protein
MNVTKVKNLYLTECARLNFKVARAKIRIRAFAPKVQINGLARTLNKASGYGTNPATN